MVDSLFKAGQVHLIAGFFFIILFLKHYAGLKKKKKNQHPQPDRDAKSEGEKAEADTEQESSDTHHSKKANLSVTTTL